MKLKIAVASLLAAASMSVFAADQTVTLDPATINYFDAVTTPTDGLLSGGSDTITFDGLAAGLYEIVITVSGQNLNWDLSNTTLNGKTGAWDASIGRLKFIGFDTTDTSPFVLNLAGSVLNPAALAGYSGEVTVTAVPEPTTYGMLLGGLGLLGFMARRKSKQA